jgi:isoleucyl-tRNA synthetase
MKAVSAGLQGLGQAELRAFAAGGSLTVEGEALRRRRRAAGADAEAGAGGRERGRADGGARHEADRGAAARGLAREVVNRMQNLRKTADLDVSQRIHVTLRCGGSVAASAGEFAEMIRGETLAASLEVVAAGGELTAAHVAGRDDRR